MLRRSISTGERSRVTAGTITVVDSNIGIACKDGSKITVDQANLRGCEVGFTAYQKKPEFGPGWIEVYAADLMGIGTPTMVERGSVVVLEGELLPASLEGVESILYPEEGKPR